DRGQRHDAAAAVARDCRPQQVHEHVVTEVVRGELRLPARADARLRASHDPGVVDDDRDAAAAGEEAITERMDGRQVPEVELIDLDAVDAVQRLRRSVTAAGRNDDVRAGSGERSGRLEADARVAAGDDRQPPG